MSLIRQVWLLLLLTLAIAVLGAVGVSVGSARQYLQAQLSLKNNDTAQAMALTMSQSGGDMTTIELMLSSQFDTGAYERIELLDVDGHALVSRRMAHQASQAPAWFVHWLGIDPAVGVAQVSDGWKQRGRLEVVSQVGYAQDELWGSTKRLGGWAALVAMGAAAAAYAGVRRLRRPLHDVVEQAGALIERRFVMVQEPSVPELREVSRAMNTMVARVKGMFDDQVAQVEQWRRTAHCDSLTGVYNRGHFLERLQAWLEREDGPARGGVVLVRVLGLHELNHRIGHKQTDEYLKTVVSALQASAGAPEHHAVGRLNGSDFAVALAQTGALAEVAADILARLKALRVPGDQQPEVAIGAVGWRHGVALSSVLATADQTLARAEERGPFSLVVDDSDAVAALGEAGWRQRIESALSNGRVRLMEYRLVGPSGALVHLECPTRLQLDEDGEWLAAAQWLSMAGRVQLMGRVDLAAVDLALQASRRDGVDRAVNVGTGSLADASFMPGLRRLLMASRDVSSHLWIEVGESVVTRMTVALRELIGLCHAYGVRVGLEHAGGTLHGDASALLECGVDFVKLDASQVRALDGDASRVELVRQTVRMLHSLDLQVFAEGVVRQDDVDALWLCAVDGVTGPAIGGA